MASSDVDAPVADVFAFLVDLRNHWRLAGAWIDVVALTPPDGPATGATVRLRGPVGLVLAVRTKVEDVEAPSTIRGRGSCGRSRAGVQWRLDDIDDARTRVRVEVRLRRASPVHRLLWGAGGRGWLERRLAATVGGLGRELRAYEREPLAAVAT